MINLIISILCSVSVGVLFKYIKAKTSVNIFLITINYLCAIVATYVCFRPEIDFIPIVYDRYTITLSVLLPSVFILLSLSIRYSGIIKTDIAQRISLVIPVACSYWLFNEVIPTMRWVGIITGFVAFFFILNKGQKATGNHPVYLILVFLGYGIIDVLFKQVALQKRIPYTVALFYIFCGCFIFASLITLISFFKKKVILQKSAVFYGILLGLFNFLNIYFYLKAHQSFANNPTTVFATMNFGVILLGTLIGAIYFKEKLSGKNILGLVLAVIAIVFVVLSQLGKI
ncbi:MAG TPA: EamA/RhaT family transporter [Hanamia sp.]|nr:EamA/RhaT family transporter [Hanamia sp.]